MKDFDYDACGRTTKIQTSSYTRNFSYDYEDRITQITGLPTTNTFAYNGFDTRTKKVDAAGTSNYQRIGANVTAPAIADGSATYTPSVSERRSGSTSYLHAGPKNADMRTNSSQASTGTKRYDAFGLQVGGVGTWAGPFGYAGKFGYQSSEDAELMVLGHRYYDPATGRFLTRDPARDGKNWFAYCEGNPLAAFDSIGLGKGNLVKIFKIIIDAGGRRRGAPLSNGQARNSRLHEHNIEVVSRDGGAADRVGEEIENTVPGRTKRHDPHHPDTFDKTIGNEGHYQTDGHGGHTFITKLMSSLLLLVDFTNPFSDAADVARLAAGYLDPLVEQVRDGINYHRFGRYVSEDEI